MVYEDIAEKFYFWICFCSGIANMLVVFELLKSHASVYFFVLSSILSCEKQGLWIWILEVELYWVRCLRKYNIHCSASQLVNAVVNTLISSNPYAKPGRYYGKWAGTQTKIQLSCPCMFGKTFATNMRPFGNCFNRSNSMLSSSNRFLSSRADQNVVLFQLLVLFSYHRELKAYTKLESLETL